MVIVVRRPEEVEFHWESVLKIFKPIVWFATLVSLLLVVTTYWACVNYDQQKHKESWGGSILTVFGHWTLASFYRRVGEGGPRCILTVWSIFSLLFTTWLSTGIVTRMTIPSFTARVDSAKQLIEGDYYWSVEYYNRFRSNKQMREFLFDLQDIWVKKFEKKYIYLQDKEILKRGNVESKIALLTQQYDDTVLVFNTEGLVESNILKKFRLVKQAMSESHVSIGVKKLSPLLKPLTIMNLKIVEFGLVEHWKRDVMRRWRQYDTSHLLVEKDIPSLGEHKKITFSIFLSVLYLLLLGLALASTAFLIEVYW